MKFTLIILCVGFLHLRAFSQEVTMTVENARLENIFKEIRKQTGYNFLYNDEMIQDTKPVTINVSKARLDEVLRFCFKDQPLTYVISNKMIIVKPADPQKKTLESDIKSNTVTGTVIDATKKEPMPGVHVVIKGTTMGVATDKDGKFSLEAEPGDMLVFSFIGFKTVETEPDGRTAISVDLEEEISRLKEVTVNAGYYDVADKEKTGSISKVTSETIQLQPVTNPLQAIQGRVPGIYIEQVTGVPGSNFQVRIRGTNSISSGNDPFYVIDGVPFISGSLSDVNTSVSLYGGMGVSPLNSINPNDIESIEILKDSDATAIYGSRGANGVVLITTKRGKAGAVKFDLNVKTGVSVVRQRINMLSTKDYIAMRKEALSNDGEVVPRIQEYDINGTWDQSRDTDWQDVLFGGTANMTDINANLSGGGSETQFLFAAGYNAQGTVFPGDNLADKISTHFSVVHASQNKKFSAKFSSYYILNNSNFVSTDLTNRALNLAPDAPPLYKENGDLNWANDTWSNPVAHLKNRFDALAHNLISNVELGYAIMGGIRIKTNIGLNDMGNKEARTSSSDAVSPSFATPASSKLEMGTSSTRSWIVEPQIDWETKISKGKLSILTGATYQDRTSDAQREIFIGFPSNALINDPKSAATVKLDMYNYAQYHYGAVYGRLNYKWDEKYILNITGRRDGSSRFGPGKQFANLGAAGLAWIFSNEKFLKDNLPGLSFGKLRGSYGLTGNDQIGDYQYLDTYVSSTPYQGVSSLFPSRLFNPDYGWEVNRKMEVAFELGFFDDRLLLTTARYRNVSSNQLIDYQLAGTTGYSSVLMNFPATVQNSGWEVELNTTNLTGGALHWTTGINITFPRNILTSFPNLESSSYANTYVVGKSLHIFRQYHYLGVDPVTGLYQVKDLNGDGQFTIEDRKSIALLDQDFYGGINNSFSFKGLQLDVFFSFVRQGGNFFISNRAAFQPGYWDSNQPSNILEGRWQHPGDKATRQLFSRSDDAYDADIRYGSSDANFGKIYFMRLKTVSISYHLPETFLGSKVKSRVYAQGQNLLTFTNYTGLDPETGSQSLPPLTTLVFGLQLTF